MQTSSSFKSVNKLRNSWLKLRIFISMLKRSSITIIMSDQLALYNIKQQFLNQHSSPVNHNTVSVMKQQVLLMIKQMRSDNQYLTIDIARWTVVQLIGPILFLSLITSIAVSCDTAYKNYI